jgi:hypothetical protein
MAAKVPRQIKNPLTLIAVFAGLAEVAATGVLPVLEGEVQNIFVWYVMLFPFLLVIAFFVTLNFNNRVLYAPADFRDERHFMETLTATYAGGTNETETLRNFWKPEGVINRRNERRLKDWLKSNGLDSGSITFFLGNELFSDARRRAVSDLGL